MQTTLRHTTILLAALVAAVAVGAAQAAPAALQAATSTCWRDVVNDWIQHQPNIVGDYPIPCYTQAIQHLNSLPDVAGYSSAPDDIHRALLAALRNDRSDGGVGGSSSSGGGAGGGGGGGSNPPSSNNPDTGNNSSPSASGQTPIDSVFGAHDATSIPLPLIVLGSLAILLALAALGTWLARRVQSRRGRPGPPAPAPAVSRRR